MSATTTTAAGASAVAGTKATTAEAATTGATAASATATASATTTTAAAAVSAAAAAAASAAAAGTGRSRGNGVGQGILDAGEGVYHGECQILRARDRAQGDHGRKQRVFDYVLAGLVLGKADERRMGELRSCYFQNRLFQRVLP